MPTYDYQCQTCGEAFELFQSFSEEALKKCPSKKSGLGPGACTSPGRGKVVKVYSAPGITFKGSGFYKNDSRSGSGPSSSSSGSSETTKKSDDTSKSTKDTSPKSTDKASGSSSTSSKSSDSSSSTAGAAKD